MLRYGDRESPVMRYLDFAAKVSHTRLEDCRHGRESSAKVGEFHGVRLLFTENVCHSFGASFTSSSKKMLPGPGLPRHVLHEKIARPALMHHHCALSRVAIIFRERETIYAMVPIHF